MKGLDIAAVYKDINIPQQSQFILRLARAHKFFPCVAGPAPDIFCVAEFPAYAVRQLEEHRCVEQRFPAKKGQALDVVQ